MAAVAKAWMAVVLAVAASVAGAEARASSPDEARLELERAERARGEAVAGAEWLAVAAMSVAAEEAALRAAATALDARRAAAAERLQGQRSVLAALLAASRSAPTEMRRRLVIAGLAQAMAQEAQEITGLARARAALGGRLRGAVTASRRAAARAASAEAMRIDAGARWRSALRVRIATIAPGAGDRPNDGTMRLVVAGPAELQRRPAPPAAAPWLARTPKRSLGGELRLDPRLLRAAVPPARAKRLLPIVRAQAAGPLLPIAGTRNEPAHGFRHRVRELMLTTRVSQTVSAPISGEVVYARRFRDLGPLLIIERGGGYHAVLVGMTRLDVREGARLVAGQSVGRIEARSDGPASLHMQLRHEGVPLDPAVWPRVYHDKVAS